MEDRFSAIRVAIGTAQDKDAVIIAGKGAEDFQEFGDIESGDILRVTITCPTMLNLPWSAHTAQKTPTALECSTCPGVLLLRRESRYQDLSLHCVLPT